MIKRLQALFLAAMFTVVMAGTVTPAQATHKPGFVDATFTYVDPANGNILGYLRVYDPDVARGGTPEATQWVFQEAANYTFQLHDSNVNGMFVKAGLYCGGGSGARLIKDGTWRGPVTWSQPRVVTDGYFYFSNGFAPNTPEYACTPGTVINWRVDFHMNNGTIKTFNNAYSVD